MAISIKFLPGKQVVEASHDESILEAALGAEVEISHSCGGYGTCGTCRVWVVEGLEGMSPRNEVEQEMADDRKFDPRERLCCQNLATPGLVLKIPNTETED